MTNIDIYPMCTIPKWLIPGAWCHVLGEGNDLFIVEDIIFNNIAVKIKGHGNESINKCYQSMDELEIRRGWK